MSRSSQPRRGRGRPRREYRIRVVGERLEQPDYNKLARALLEHAAMQAREAAAKANDDEPRKALDHAIDDEEVSS